MTLSEMRNVLQFIKDEDLEIIHIGTPITIRIDDWLKPSDIAFFFSEWKAFFKMYPYGDYEMCVPMVRQMIRDYTISRYEAMEAKRLAKYGDDYSCPTQSEDETY